MPLPRPLPPALRGRPFLVTEALALGVTRRRLRAPDLRAPHHGVRVPAELPQTLPLACASALLVLPPGAVFSGRTAVALHELPTPWQRTGAGAEDEPGLEVAVPRGAARPRLAEVSVRAAGLHRDAVVVRRAGLPVLHPAEVWAQRCADLDDEDAVALGDAVRRDHPAEAMAAALARSPGRERRRRAEELLAQVRYRVDSPLETRVRLLLLAAGAPHPCCGDAVREGGHPVAWPDLSWPDLRVAVEVDGRHHLEHRQRQRDLGRQRVLEDLGWRVVVVTGQDVLVRPSTTTDLVLRALTVHGWVPGGR